MRVCIVSQTLVTQEPRVLRQIRTFRDREWDVSVIGFPGTSPIPADWDFHDLTLPVQSSISETAGLDTSIHRLAKKSSSRANSILRQILRRARSSLKFGAVPIAETPNHATNGTTVRTIEQLLSLDSPSPLTHEEADAIFYRSPQNEYAKESVVPHVPHCDLVVAHDFDTLPLAALLCERFNVPMAIDVHEYATQQYNFDESTFEAKYFSFVTRPLIDALNGKHLPTAIGVTTVSDGIGIGIARDYHLTAVPTTVRSIPFYSHQDFRPTGEKISLLYHGLINPARHLEVVIESLALWSPEYCLTLRGPASPEYKHQLLALAKSLGVAERLTIEPPVPFSSIVSAANQSDIGLFAFLNYSDQRQFTLPNKFFEYIMAGLAVAITDVPTSTPIIEQNAIGQTIEAFTPQAIASAINSFTRDKIDAAKRNSLELATKLCWEKEQGLLVRAYQLEQLEARGDTTRGPAT